MTSFAVLGPGGVGGFVAAALSRAGADVTVVARDPTASVLARHGFRVQSVRLGKFTARPAVVTVLRAPTDVLLVATKASGLAAGLGRIETDPGLVVPLLNGLEHMALLRERFGDRVAAGVIRVESDRPAPGEIVQTSPALRIDIADDAPARRAAVHALAATLEAAEIPVRLDPSEADLLWSKLLRLNALACTTSAYDLPLGEIRADPVRQAALEACVLEAAAVAAAEGAHLDPAATLGELRDAHPGQGSSMRRDLAAGREPELDAIPGAVIRAGARHGLACPVISELTERIRVRM